jgi:hypothetical protein
MANPTPPLLKLQHLTDGEFTVIPWYQGIRVTIIPGGGGTVTYSFVDSQGETIHDGPTSVDVTDITVVEVQWPWLAVSVAGGTARVANV